ncbi:agamous-like MADS-box protein AGL65 [Juglans regia]|uniref:Agamous-like MADS-box protein AGL65 n=1 Tax=Juglans regia TaxID=51240 RepID=A0A6P9EMA9_JUGRE|nr:agamous-like MADS-box protein AGL65 [Juglans regia]
MRTQISVEKLHKPAQRGNEAHGMEQNFEEVIAKYAHITPHERAKRKLENLEVLKKTFKKLDHDVNIENFMGSSYWSDLDKINNVEYLRHIEDLLRESVNRLHLHKENLGQHQLTSLESTIQVVKAKQARAEEKRGVPLFKQQ